MKLRTHHVAVLLVALGLAGCVADRRMPVTTVPSPAAWVNVAGAPDTVPVPVIPADWWRSFESGELGRLIAEAERNSPDLAASVDRVAQAAARARAAGAGLYPALDGSGGGGRNWPGRGRTGDSFQAGLDASYQVDVWGMNRSTRDSAEASQAASAFDRAAFLLSLNAEVATTYFQYLNLHDRLENARQIVEIAERVLDLVETRVRFGAASELELAQQRGTVASLRANIPTLEQQRAATLNALAQLVGTTPGELRIDSGSMDALALPRVSPGLPSGLLVRRPDLARAEAQLQAARADVEVARAAMMPSIRLTGSSGYSSAELSSLFTPAGLLTNLASGLAAPVFDAGRLAAQRDAAEASADEAVEAYRSAVVAAFRDVEDALAAVRYLAETEAARQMSLEQARRTYEFAEIRYRGGATDFLSLLDAQRSLYQEEDSLEQVRLARLSAAVALYKALGGGWCDEARCGAAT